MPVSFESLPYPNEVVYRCVMNATASCWFPRDVFDVVYSYELNSGLLFVGVSTLGR